MLCHATTSDCANREEIYAMVKDGGRGRTSDMTRAHLACPPPPPPLPLSHPPSTPPPPSLSW
eukprot:9336278-Pyramimonas_sp.AAC.1